MLCTKNVLLVCYVDPLEKRLNNNVYKYDLPRQIKSVLLLLLEWNILCKNYGGIAQPNSQRMTLGPAHKYCFKDFEFSRIVKKRDVLLFLRRNLLLCLCECYEFCKNAVPHRLLLW